MAEQYQSFQGREPNIDINLFPNAMAQGINAGNAQKTTFGAIASGITQGIQGGIQTVQGIQTIQANANALDPEVVQAKKDILVSQADQAKSQAYQQQLSDTITKANEETVVMGQTAELEAKAQTAVQTRDDLVNKRAIAEALGTGLPGNIQSALTDPNFQGTLLRDPGLALQALGQYKAAGGDPVLVEQLGAKFDAVAQQKLRQNIFENEQKRKAEYATKNDEKFTDSYNTLKGLNGFDKVSNPGNTDFNYKDLKIYDAATVKIGANGKLVGDPVKQTPEVQENLNDKAGQQYVFARGLDVLDRNLIGEEGRKYRAALEEYKTGAAARNYPNKSLVVEEAPGEASKFSTQNTGLAAGAAPSSAANQSVIEAARARNKQKFAVSDTAGNGNSYQAMISKGSQLARSNVQQPNYIQTSQATPVASGTVAITQPIVQERPSSGPSLAALSDFASGSKPPPVPKLPPGSKDYAQDRLQQALGTPDPISLNVEVPSKAEINQSVVEKIEAIPAMQNASAMLKGLAAIESGGNINAVSFLGANSGAGVMQIGSAAAQDLGISGQDRYDPDIAVPAAADYLATQYDNINRTLQNELGAQGLTVNPDPRLVLAAYNGGLRDVQAAVRAGNYTWEDVKSYLLKVKSKRAGIENTTYPDKVILASIPFVKGGNASDDSYIRSLLGFGIVTINDRQISS